MKHDLEERGEGPLRVFFSVLLSTYTPLCDRTDILFSRSEFLRRKDCELADSDLDGGCGW